MEATQQRTASRIERRRMRGPDTLMPPPTSHLSRANRAPPRAPPPCDPVADGDPVPPSRMSMIETTTLCVGGVRSDLRVHRVLPYSESMYDLSMLSKIFEVVLRIGPSLLAMSKEDFSHRRLVVGHVTYAVKLTPPVMIRPLTYSPELNTRRCNDDGRCALLDTGCDRRGRPHPKLTINGADFEYRILTRVVAGFPVGTLVYGRRRPLPVPIAITKQEP